MSLAVGYDGGESAGRALDTSIVLARDLGEKLFIVCGVAPAGGLGEEYESVEEAIVEDVGPHVMAAVRLAHDAGVEAEAILVDADPVGALDTVVEEHSPRMIIVGYGSTDRIRRALFGAVSRRVVRGAEVPVLVVP